MIIARILSLFIRPVGRPDVARGPVCILTTEIGASFSPEMECKFLFLEFINQLILEYEREFFVLPVDRMRCSEIRAAIVASDDARKAAHALAKEWLNQDGLCGYNVPRNIAWSIYFGLEVPCQSRHAADAAAHIWEARYGIRYFDSHSLRWRKEWTRAIFARALRNWRNLP